MSTTGDCIYVCSNPIYVYINPIYVYSNPNFCALVQASVRRVRLEFLRAYQIMSTTGDCVYVCSNPIYVYSNPNFAIWCRLPSSAFGWSSCAPTK